MDTKGICILVVNDDLTCKNIVSEMLHHCNYQVLHVGSDLDVINAIWEAKNNLDLVLTNVHKLEPNGAKIVQHIQNKLSLHVILMCADKIKIQSKGQPFRFSAYVLKGLNKVDVNNLWKFALEKEKREQKSSISDIGIETNKTYAAWFNQKLGKSKESFKEKADEGGREEVSPIAKKTRVVWTSEMHRQFLEAIEIIGYEKAVPKKIVEVMGIPGLTRENVASHLQKFRCSVKRTQDATTTNYLNTHNKFYRSMGGNYVGDQHQMSTRFVGYRLTNNGNSIEFGNLIESTNTNDNNISRETRASVQGNAANNGNYFGVQNSVEFSEMAQSFEEFLDEAMVIGTRDQGCSSQLGWEEFEDVLFDDN